MSQVELNTVSWLLIFVNQICVVSRNGSSFFVPAVLMYHTLTYMYHRVHSSSFRIKKIQKFYVMKNTCNTVVCIVVAEMHVDNYSALVKYFSEVIFAFLVYHSHKYMYNLCTLIMPWCVCADGIW